MAIGFSPEELCAMVEQERRASVAKDDRIIWPAQCECGHIFLERYSFRDVTDEGNIGFCWCGFCRTKRMVKATAYNTYEDSEGRI